MTEDCSQRCTCRLTGVLECSPAGCGEGEICAVSSYVRNCFRGERGGQGSPLRALCAPCGCAAALAEGRSLPGNPWRFWRGESVAGERTLFGASSEFG